MTGMPGLTNNMENLPARGLPFLHNICGPVCRACYALYSQDYSADGSSCSIRNRAGQLVRKQHPLSPTKLEHPSTQLSETAGPGLHISAHCWNVSPVPLNRFGIDSLIKGD